MNMSVKSALKDFMKVLMNAWDNKKYNANILCEYLNAVDSNMDQG